MLNPPNREPTSYRYASHGLLLLLACCCNVQLPRGEGRDALAKEGLALRKVRTLTKHVFLP